MRHFVRFANRSAAGAIDSGGWRVRIFLTSGEARDFAHRLAANRWRVETGAYDDGEARTPGPLARRFRALVLRADDATGRA